MSRRKRDDVAEFRALWDCMLLPDAHPLRRVAEDCVAHLLAKHDADANMVARELRVTDRSVRRLLAERSKERVANNVAIEPTAVRVPHPEQAWCSCNECNEARKKERHRARFRKAMSNPVHAEAHKARNREYMRAKRAALRAAKGAS